MSTTITQPGLVHLVNASESPAMLRHRLTHAEAVDRAQLLALFDQSDARGQALLLIIAGIHAARFPKEKA